MALSLEYIVKFIILLVALSAIALLIMHFYNQFINRDVLPGNGEKPPKTESIQKETFTSADVARYIESCWSKTGEESGDLVCYILQGGFSASKNDVLSQLPPSLTDKTEITTDFSGQSVVIDFKDIGDRIVVS